MDVRAGRGSLVCVGLGITLGAHLAPRARHCIESADVVYVAASDSVVERWVQDMRPDARSLQPLYREGKPRFETYREMATALVDGALAGQRVCGAFYGHPGVFAKVPRDARDRLRARGLDATIEPGISAADCLYADLGIDPGQFGCQHYEASQLLLYRRRIDPSAYLVLWQAGIVGDLSCTRFQTGPAQRGLLVERLLRDYPADHPVIVYEAPTLPIAPPRITRLPLHALVDADVYMHSTVVVPPGRSMERDEAMFERMRRLDSPAPHRRARPMLALVHT